MRLTPLGQSNPPKRIYIVQSYEKGHVCGAAQAEGISTRFAQPDGPSGATSRSKPSNDTYRTNTSPETCTSRELLALDEIARSSRYRVHARRRRRQRGHDAAVGRSDVAVVFSA